HPAEREVLPALEGLDNVGEYPRHPPGMAFRREEGTRPEHPEGPAGGYPDHGLVVDRVGGFLVEVDPVLAGALKLGPAGVRALKPDDGPGPRALEEENLVALAPLFDLAGRDEGGVGLPRPEPVVEILGLNGIPAGREVKGNHPPGGSPVEDRD